MFWITVSRQTVAGEQNLLLYEGRKAGSSQEGPSELNQDAG